MPGAAPSAETPISKAAQALQLLLSQQEAARTQLQAIHQQRDALLAEVAELKTQQSVLEARVEQEGRHAERLRALEGDAAALVRGLKEEAERDLQRHRTEQGTLTAQVSAASERLASLRDEAALLEGRVAELRATAEVLGRERLALETTTRQLAEEQAESARRTEMSRVAVEDLERRRTSLQISLAEAQGLLEQVRGQVEALREERRDLEQSFRPLQPYHPPVQRLRLATVEVQVNTKLQQHDATALRLYAEQSGMELKRIVTEALRNYLSAEVYQVALGALEEDARHGLEPQAEAAVERVPPEGAASKLRRGE